MAYVQTHFTSWSFSRFQTYDQCPAKAKYAYLDKLPQPVQTDPNDPLVRGDRIHKEAEGFIRGRVARVPKDLKPVTDELKNIKKAVTKPGNEFMIEETLALRRDWTVTTWNDWKGCWLRIKMDVAWHDPEAITTDIRDFKTGKFRPENQTEYLMQLDLYGLGSFMRWPDKKLVVTPRLVYTDHNIVYPSGDDAIRYTFTDAARLKKEWEKRVTPMMNDRKFAPKPNAFCKWCPFGVSKDGPCKFG